MKRSSSDFFAARSSIALLLIWSNLIGRLYSISANHSGEQQCMLAPWWAKLNLNFSDFGWLVTLGLIFLITSCLAHIFTNIYNARVLGEAELVHIFMTKHSYSGNAHVVTIPLQIKTKSTFAAFWKVHFYRFSTVRIYTMYRICAINLICWI